MKKNPLITIVAFAVVGVALALWATGHLPLVNPAPQPPVASAAPGPVPVSVARVLEKSVTEWDEFSGRVKAIDHVEIRPQVSGIIEAVHFADGQLVKQGDLLFTIDPRPFQAALAQAEATVAGAEAKLALAQTNLARSQELIESHVPSRKANSTSTTTPCSRQMQA